LPHGDDGRHYRIVRIADGRVLHTFDCLSGPYNPGPRASAPAWANDSEAECLRADSRGPRGQPGLRH
jgi:hypothetical protein